MTSLIYSIPIYVIISISLLVAVIGGRLLPTWMFINSMQLVFHVSLIKTDLPAQAHFFILDFLNTLRLHFSWTEELIEDIIGNPAIVDYKLIQSEESTSFFTGHLRDCGYHFSFFSNLFLFILAACAIFVV